MNFQNPVILFDGVCNLCNSSVQFIIRKDKKKRFYFTSLQGDVGQALMREHNLDTDKFNSFVLLHNNVVYKKSTAALRVMKILGGGWQLFYGFMIVPPFIRDAVYNFIAVNRYRWFGKRETCMLPAPELKTRFLE